MTRNRIENAVEVINYAIKNGISVTEASTKFDYADTYVKNVKSAIINKFENDSIDEEDYHFFMDAYKKYERLRNINTHDYSNPNLGVDFDGKKLPNKPVENKTTYVEDGDRATVEVKFSTKNNERKCEPNHLDGDHSLEDYDEQGRLNWDVNRNGDPHVMVGGTHYGYPYNHIKTPEQLLEGMGVDVKLWEITQKLVNKWDVTSWKSGQPQTWENFQVKLRLERKKEVFDARKLYGVLKELSEELPENVTIPVSYSQPENLKENNLLEISLFDLHLGKLGWAGEVGENFDTKIAYARFMDAIDNLLIRAQGFNFSEILFPVGNDFFNSDNLHNTTTAGTPQDEDLRWQKTFKLGCKLIRDALLKLKATGVPIKVLVIPGNHDFERMYYLGSVIEVAFENDEQVTVDNSANPRKYYRFGEVLLGFTHGKDEKENSLPLLMASEQKKLWGETTFREFHLGHFHKKRSVKFTVFDKAQVLNEEFGVIVRYLSSLTGTEEWHHKKGYVGNAKAGEAFIWNDKIGQIGHLNFNFTEFDREE